MPGMPFHLEKGHALMALEDLLNNPAHRAVLTTAYDGLRTGIPLGQIFADIAAQAPLLDAYGGGNVPVNDAGGLGPFVSGAWFGQPSSSGSAPNSYWIDYTGDVDGVVRETLLFAIEMAGPADRKNPLPQTAFNRRIELFWHCGQRWFEAWLTWDDTSGPIRVLFTTPPHTAGDVLSRASAAPPGQAMELNAATDADPARDMVLVTEAVHTERRFLNLTFWPTGQFDIPLPSVGIAWEGTGTVGAWRILADGGGVQPVTPFG